MWQNPHFLMNIFDVFTLENLVAWFEFSQNRIIENNLREIRSPNNLITFINKINPRN